jgi:DNA-binding LytR/AlgR family response regulator
MIALVFLQSIACQQQLIALLHRLNIFSSIYEAQSAGHCLALAEKHPDSIGFYSVAQSSRNLASRYWIAVGEKDSEALLAFEHNASGFIASPFNGLQIENAIASVEQKYICYERTSQFQQLVNGLCKQYGVSELALLAKLRRQLDQTQKPGMVGVRSEKGWCCLNPVDVKWIETLNENIIVRATLNDLLKRFNDQRFKRCNRSVAVNEEHVTKLEQRLNQQHAIMSDGATFKITHKYYYLFWQTR